MQTRYGQSPWIAGYPSGQRPSYPRLRGEHETEVVIVGAGLTGCATAVACALAGSEADRDRGESRRAGDSGRAAGLLLPDPGPSFRDIAKRHGLRAAKLIFSSWRRAGLDAAAQLRRLSISCGLAPRDHLLVGPQDDSKALLREYDAREAAGLSVSWLTRRQITALTPLDVAAAMRVRDGFVLDPYRACLGLAAAAVETRRDLLRADAGAKGPGRAPSRRSRGGRRRDQGGHRHRGHGHARRRNIAPCAATSSRARSITRSPSPCPRRCASRSAAAASR